MSCTAELLRSKEVKARKDHVCSWCAERIDKGDPARYRAYKHEGIFKWDWMHPECFDAMNELDSYDLEQGWHTGDFMRGSTEDAVQTARANRDKYEVLLLEQIRRAGLPEPEREYRFAALSVGWKAGQRLGKGEQGLRERLAQGGVTGLGDWRFDFAWPEQLMAVEIEGGIWVGGRHQRPKGFTEDCRKYREAAALGWRVFRFTGEEVRTGEALRFLEGFFRR